MSQSHEYESRGVLPPAHLSEWIYREVTRAGDVVVAERVGLSRTALIRVAARLPVTRGSISLVERDFDAHRQAA